MEYHYHEYSGRLDLIIDPLARTRTYDYWLDGSLKKISYGQPSGLPVTPNVEYFYDDPFARLTKVITDENPSNEITYSYYPVDGQTLGAGMLHQVNGQFGNDTITYEYDELGRRTKRQINGTANQETYDYDPTGRVREIDNNLGFFTYNYIDPTGRLEELIYPNGQVTNFAYYGQNDDFRLKEIENLENGVAPDPLSVFEYAYTQTGMIETWKQQAGAATPDTWTFGYDRAHQLTGAVSRDSSNVVQQSFNYGYDRAGNRTHERRASGELYDTPGRGAVYNENNQLTSYSDEGAVRFAGEIDQGGIVWVNGQQAEMDVDDSGAEPVQTFETWLGLEPGLQQVILDAVNAAGLSSQRAFQVDVAAQGNVTLGYDAAGNLIKRTEGTDETHYHWDGENRLVEIVYPDNSKTEFQYDGLGRRIRIHEKNASGGTLANRTFVWDVLRIAEERDATGANVSKRFYGLGAEVVTGGNAGDYFYTKDHLGSVREVTDDQGTLQARYDYDPYGRVTQTAGTFESDFLFTGHFHHAKSGLHLAPYRAYDADFGRWLSRDPLGWAELLPEGPNVYGYVGGNPINHVDPLGLMSKCGWAALAGVTGALLTAGSGYLIIVGGIVPIIGLPAVGVGIVGAVVGVGLIGVSAAIGFSPECLGKEKTDKIEEDVKRRNDILKDLDPHNSFQNRIN
jgi:RHS repeat-associated protein